MSQSFGSFQVHDERFQSIIGPTPMLQLLAENDSYPFAHEAGVYIAATNHLFMTGARCVDPEGQQSEITTNIPMGNGGINYGDDGILICGQGSLAEPSGLYFMSTTAPFTSKLLKGDFYGRPFNSVNNVVVHSDGSIWFTDPAYGFEQGYRPTPSLPSQVYRWNPANGSTRAIVDGFGKPNGIYFSPDEKTLYVTDTDWMRGDGSTNNQRASSM
ncbi:hypothetical protein BBP40_001390 [Aspergillus hancockii]|nr:hypothetical protein BBP40_001390 [Aspergillus hancockii]